MQGWLATFRRSWAQPHIRWLAAILLVALVLRVLWVASVQPDPRDGRLDDTVLYHGGALGLAEGDGYINPYSGTPTARWSIGYPLLLAPLYLLPGDDVAAARGLNVAAGLVTVAGVYYLGRRLFDQRAGLLAAALVALFPSQVFFSTLVLSEVVYTALAVTVLALALAWTTSERRPPPWQLGLLGLAVAAAALVRPEGVVLVAVLGLAWLAVHRSWQRAAEYVAVLVVALALVFVPWTVRNAVQLGSPVVGTTGLGGVLVQGHSATSDGQPNFALQVDLENRFLHVELPEREVRVNNAGIRDSLEFAVNHLPKEIELTAYRFAHFVRGDRGAVDWVQHRTAPPAAGESVAGEARVLSHDVAQGLGLLSDVYYYLLLAVALVGLPLLWRGRRPEHLLLLLPVVFYVALWSLLFVSESRYHFPMLPMLSLAAAGGATAALQVLRDGEAA